MSTSRVLSGVISQPPVADTGRPSSPVGHPGVHQPPSNRKHAKGQDGRAIRHGLPSEPRKYVSYFAWLGTDTLYPENHDNVRLAVDPSSCRSMLPKHKRYSGGKKATTRRNLRAAVFKKYKDEDSLWLSETLKSINKARSAHADQEARLTEAVRVIGRLSEMIGDLIAENAEQSSAMAGLWTYITDCGAKAGEVTSRLASIDDDN